MRGLVEVGRLWVWGVIAVVLSALTGCSGFFVPPNSGGGGGGTTNGNRVYVANVTANTMAGFTVGTNTLTSVPSSPLALGYAPTAVVTTPSNSFLYVASLGAIYVYTINSDGSLSGASQQALVTVSALDVSPDGQWLFGLDSLTTVVDEFQINTSTGGLTAVATTPYTVANTTFAPKAIRVSPNGALVFAALGTSGDVVFTLNTSTGVLVNSQGLSVSATTSDNALAIDSNTAYLYIARSGTNGGLAVYQIGAGGALTPINGSPFATGAGPTSVVLDRTGKYVYVANRTDNNISGYTIGTGAALTALSGSPYASGTQVNSLGIDQSGMYLLAAATGGSPDLSMYSFDATVPGKLNLATSAATGTAPTGAIALATTH
jgi:6-phosphogluconolactonase